MPDILLIKTSSLGDVVHNFPVATDIRARFPSAGIDWVVEEAYAPLVRLHPAVREVIPVAIRRWRRTIVNPETWREIRAFRRRLRNYEYDAIIDTQGLVKSAFIARRARGTRHGFDPSCAREPLAARAYDRTHIVSRDQHAVVRNRVLAAASLGYAIDTAVDYGLRVIAPPPIEVRTPYCVLLHATSRTDKEWPEAHWVELARELAGKGYSLVAPWGGAAEEARARRVAAAVPGVLVPPALALDGMAALLARATAVVGVDTGLSHLAVALAVPTVALYLGSDPALTGLYGAARARNLGGIGQSPAVADVLAQLAEWGV